MQYTINKKNLIFDFDGTIISYEDFVDISKLKEFFPFSNLENFDTFVNTYHKATSDFEFVEQFIVKEKQSFVLDTIIELNMKQVESKYFDPIIKETLSSLANKYNLFMITGRDYYSMNHALKINDLHNLFIDIICSDINEKAKPNPDKGLKLLDKYNLNIDKTFYIGDKYTDVEFAKNLNFKFIGAHWLNQYQLKKQICCNSIVEIEEFIN